jgi:hypothetical protein
MRFFRQLAVVGVHPTTIRSQGGHALLAVGLDHDHGRLRRWAWASRQGALSEGRSCAAMTCGAQAAGVGGEIDRQALAVELTALLVG